MKYAKSLLYGIIVDAIACDYHDYANWQLRCPKCGEPVYLIGASKRQEHARLAPKSKQIVIVRSAEITASFAILRDWLMMLVKTLTLKSTKVILRNLSE